MDPATARPSDLARRTYAGLPAAVAATRRRLGRPLTLTEKVLVNHLERAASPIEPADPYLALAPDRVVLQDALAQIVVLQLMTAGLDAVVAPTSIHCDHLIRARVDARTDLAAALGANEEVYELLRAAAARLGIAFWPPGSGIIHQVVLERYAFPGGMVIGTDSHTPTAGGLGMVAVGVGGGDAIDAMTGGAFTLGRPRLMGVRLTGELDGWASAKDVVLRVARELTAAGGTGAVLEYFGPGADTISATGKATICNMGAETGATASIFPFDEHMARYLAATGRGDVADLARGVAGDLRADADVESDPQRCFERVLEIDLSSLGPTVSGPDTPDAAHAVGEVADWARTRGVPVELSAALVGSCTNSSYEDMARAASLARQASAHSARARVPLLVTPGSERVRATIERDGLLGDLEAIGATVLANACGPCIGQWDRHVADPDEANTIVTSFNRNFPRRNDGRSATKAFVASPETVVAYALAGTLDFDPRTDALTAPDGTPFRLAPPRGPGLPDAGFIDGTATVVPPPPAHERAAHEPVIDAASERLQALEPFRAWHGGDLVDLPVLAKARGKCTTDQISPAGRWLRFRGHLERMSANLFTGVVNAFTGGVGEGCDPLDGETRPYPEIARRLADAGVDWCVVGDENYGEGSSREHAAMEPRFRGCVAILARSFARIHETNLKKQGVLALTFVDPSDYDRIGERDVVSIVDLATLAPGRPVRALITSPEGDVRPIALRHTLSSEQIDWFEAGGALNLVRRDRAERR